MNRLPFLKKALKFDEDDLDANRAGKISIAQRETYKAPEIKPIVHIVIWGHVGVVGALLGGIALISGEPAMLLVMGGVMLLGALPFVLMRNEGQVRPAVQADVAAGKVAQTCGTVFLEQKSSSRRGTSYLLTVNGIRMSLTSTAYNAFINGDDYCVYYLPTSETLLTAEPATES